MPGDKDFSGIYAQSQLNHYTEYNDLTEKLQTIDHNTRKDQLLIEGVMESQGESIIDIALRQSINADNNNEFDPRTVTHGLNEEINNLFTSDEIMKQIKKEKREIPRL